MKQVANTMSHPAEEDITLETKNQTGQKRSCCQKLISVLSLVPKNATPPNWSFLWLIFISLFSSAFTLCFLFPFLPEMILTFGYSEEEKGTYVGLVASSVFAGRAFGSFFWGWLSDIKGRRLVLLVTIVLNGVFSFTFGFVGSLHWAMVLRFLAGLGNGTVGVAKTVLYDVSDNTNQAFHMSVISIAWGSGLILGPTLGGYLALPATKYPGVFPTGLENFLIKYPFFLPSACCLAVCAVAFVIVFWKFKEPTLVLNKEIATEEGMDETSFVADSKTAINVEAALSCQPLLEKQNSHTSSSGSSQVKPVETVPCEAEKLQHYAEIENRDDVAESADLTGTATQPLSEEQKLLSVVCHQGDHARSQNHLDEIKDREVLGDSQDKGLIGDSNNQGQGEMSHFLNTDQAEVRSNSSSGKCSRLISCWRAVRHSDVLQMLRMKDVWHGVAIYAVMSFAIIGYEDVFTIFASTAVEYGGLSFSTDEIGTALGAVSIPLMFIQIKIYPMLVAKFGIKRAYLVNSFFMFIPIQLMPMLNLLVNKKVWLWVCLVALTLPLRVAANSCFAGSSLLINNSVTSDMAGKANGIGMTATAIARTLAPTMGGALFSWTVKMGQSFGPPLDVSLAFVLFGFIVFISSLQCIFLPEHLDQQKK